MTDIVRHQGAQIAERSSFDIAGDAWVLAQKIAATEFVPVALRNKPEAVLACMLTGHEAGLSPMQSLAKIHVIEGRPAMSAEIMRALVQNRGHELWYEDVSSTAVTACGRRAEFPDRSPTKVTWTMDDAKRARLDQKNVWRSYPRNMLTARATSELCRMLFADVLAGISYTPEEIADGIDVDTGLQLEGGEPAAIPAATGTKRRAPRTAARQQADTPLADAPPASTGDLPPDVPVNEDVIDADEATLDPAPIAPIDPDPIPTPAEPWADREWQAGDWDDVPPPPQAGKTYTGPQIIAIKLAELFDIKGSGDAAREERLKAIRYILSRDDIASSKDLTPTETEIVISTLDGWPEGTGLYDDAPADQDPPPEPPDSPSPAPEPPPTAPTPRPTPPAAATAPTKAPEQWDGDAWRAFIKTRKVKVTQLLAEARRLGAEAVPPVSIATLDDVVGSTIVLDLVGWVEEISLEDGS